MGLNFEFWVSSVVWGMGDTQQALWHQGVSCGGMWGVGCGVWSAGCGMWAVGCRVWVVGCRVSGAGTFEVAVGVAELPVATAEPLIEGA